MCAFWIIFQEKTVKTIEQTEHNTNPWYDFPQHCLFFRLIITDCRWHCSDTTAQWLSQFFCCSGYNTAYLLELVCLQRTCY